MSESKRVEGWANVYLDGEGNEYFLALWSSRPNAEAHKSEGAQRLVRVVELRENDEIAPKGKLAEVQKLLGEMTDRALKAEKRSARWFVDLGLEKREPLVPEMSVADRIETSGERVEPMGERTRSRLIPERELNAAIERAEKAEAEIANVEALANKLGMEAMDTERKRLKDIIEGLRGQIEWLIKEHAQECNDFHDAKADERARFERETAAKMLAALWGSDWNGDADDATERILVRAAKLADHYFGAKEDAKG